MDLDVETSEWDKVELTERARQVVCLALEGFEVPHSHQLLDLHLLLALSLHDNNVAAQTLRGLGVGELAGIRLDKPVNDLLWLLQQERIGDTPVRDLAQPVSPQDLPTSQAVTCLDMLQLLVQRPGVRRLLECAGVAEDVGYEHLFGPVNDEPDEDEDETDAPAVRELVLQEVHRVLNRAIDASAMRRDDSMELRGIRADLHSFLEQHDDWVNLHYEPSPHQVHFSLGLDDATTSHEHLATAYLRASHLLDACFQPEDDGFVVFSSVPTESVVEHIKRRYLPSSALHDVTVGTGLWPSLADTDRDELDWFGHQLATRVKARSLNTVALVLDHLSNDFGTGDGRNSITWLVNTHQPLVFQLYDARELLVLAQDPALVRDLFERFTDWVCADCRKDIEGALSGTKD